MGVGSISTSEILINAGEQIVRQKIARLRAEIAEKEEEMRLYELLLGTPAMPGQAVYASVAAAPEAPGKSKRKKRTQPVIDAMQRLGRPATVGEITENLLSASGQDNSDSDWPASVSQTLYNLEKLGKVSKSGSFGSYLYVLDPASK